MQISCAETLRIVTFVGDSSVNFKTGFRYHRASPCIIQSPHHSANTVTLPYDKNAAVVVLPAIGGSRLQDASLKAWLSHATLRQASEPSEVLATILGALNRPYPEQGLAALRMWGQTGDRPTIWVAAADPVYLEPRLDHLCMHALGDEAVPAADHRAVFDHLQQTLAEDSGIGFARIGNCGYVRSADPLATATMPALVINGQEPNDFMPAGEAAGDYRGLRSEVEMALHDHEVNTRREAEGLPPINSLWLWGGGMAPEQQTEPHPPLFCAEPLPRGYWLSRTAVTEPWPGTIAACLDASVAGFVAVPDIEPSDIDSVERILADLRAALHAGRISQVKLFSADGIEAVIQPGDRWRFWRRTAALLQ